MAPTISLNPASLTFDYNGAYHDLQVFTRQDLLDAVQDPGNDGKTILVRAGDYGTNLEFTARHDVMTTVRGWPGDAISIGQVTLDASNLRWQGLNHTSGGLSTGQNGCENIEVLENEFHDMAGSALQLWASLPGLIDTNITFERNHVYRLRHEGIFTQGYGVVSRTSLDQFLTNIRIAYNTFDDLEADGMELAGLDGFEVIGNRVHHVHLPPDPIPDPHPDALMLWAGTKNGIVKDNHITNATDTLMGGSTSNILVENNLIAHLFGRGIDGGQTGTSTDAMEQYTLRRNTVYDCGNYFQNGGFGGLECVSMTGNPVTASNILDRNLFGSLNYAYVEQFDLTQGGGNVIQRGFRPYADDISYAPRFADLVDWLPINLPEGYEDCGYRRAPCGHTMD